jgi:endonuclease-3 related protein
MNAEVSADELMAIYDELDRMHAWRGWHWWPDADPFEVVVGSILVQNTSWANVERALERLRSANALDPAVMAALSDREIEDLVRPSGQYRQKAKKLRAFLATAERHGGFEALIALPAENVRAECLATWGIGAETADCIVAYAARQPAFPMDAYTARLFSRLGLGPGEMASYDAWQQFFLDRLTSSLLPSPSSPRDLYARYHALIVMHCKHVCRKRAPKCGECSLAPRCPAAIG